MSSVLHHRPVARAAAAGIFAVSALGLVACSDDSAGPESGVDVQDVAEDENDAGLYDGDYNAAFSEDFDTYVGEEVTLSADVNEVISPSAFTISGAEADVEPLLIVDATETPDLTPGTLVFVTGTVGQAFDLATVEDDLGIDLQDDLFLDWDQEPYVSATEVISSDPNE